MNFIKFGEAFSMVIPSQAFFDLVEIGRCRDFMVNTVVQFTGPVKRKSRPSNLLKVSRRSESYSGKHNPKVVGSSPTPATKR